MQEELAPLFMVNLSPGLFPVVKMVSRTTIRVLDDKVNALCEMRSKTQEELDTLLPSMLDRAFRGDL